MYNILVVDDDVSIHYILKRIIENEGHQVSLSSSIGEGLNMAAREPFSAVFLDIFLPDGNGLTALAEFKKSPGHPEVVMITGFGSEDDAEKAMITGAYDYISKKTPVDDIIAILSQAIACHDATNRQHTLEATSGDESPFNRKHLVGSSECFVTCLKLAEQYSRVESNVLILGETGTGKEVFARAIHENSPCKDGEFVTVDCASLPDNLAQSILFGHRKGAFTSAESNQEGLVVEADGGTLFLDEIGELPLDVQKIFLRILQERAFRPLGAGKEIQCRFRLIAATNRNLGQMVTEGRFRKDLYYRLQSCVLTLPTLRERADDIEALVHLFLKRLLRTYEMPDIKLSKAFINSLKLYRWDGNVRELMNAVEYAVSAGRFSGELLPHHLPRQIRIHATKMSFAACSLERRESAGFSKGLSDEAAFPTYEEYKKAMGIQLEKNYIRQVYRMARGDVKKVMGLSKLSKSRCYALIKTHVTPQT